MYIVAVMGCMGDIRMCHVECNPDILCGCFGGSRIAEFLRVWRNFLLSLSVIFGAVYVNGLLCFGDLLKHVN